MSTRGDPANVGIFSSTMVTGFERRELSLVNVNVHAGPVRIGSLFGEILRQFTPCSPLRKQIPSHGL